MIRAYSVGGKSLTWASCGWSLVITGQASTQSLTWKGMKSIGKGREEKRVEGEEEEIGRRRGK